MATSVARRRPGPRCILPKVILALAIAASWFGPAATNFIRFKPDTEYIYTFHSSADLKNVRKLEVQSKIGFLLVKTPNVTSGYQQIYLRVHSVVVTSDKEQVRLSEEKDFNGWFSFDLTENSTIGQVYYRHDDDDHVIQTKKAMAGLLAGNLQHPEEGQVKDGTWSYDCNETSHEGHHVASYTARVAPGYSGIIVFTKTRRTHPIPYGESEHQKVIHYHPAMQLPSLVKITDSFDAPRHSTPEFEEQLNRNDGGKLKGDDFEFPEMKSSSEGELTFVRETYSPSPNSKSENEGIVPDSILVKQHAESHSGYNSSQIKEFIYGNLTCMRKAPLKGSHMRSHCYQDLVDSLLDVSDSLQLADIVSPFFKPPLSRRFRNKADRLNMMDAVAGMHTELSQALLTDLILLTPKPNKELVERLLIASAGFIHTISQHYLDTVEDIVFKPGEFYDSIRDPEIQRVAVLVLGALAGLKWKAGDKTEAERIIVRIENKLGVHDPWAYEKTITTLSKDEQDDFHHDTVAWIEALGNAGLDRSFPHIQSYTNSTSAHPLLKRAGLHSMRQYHHDVAANILLQHALDTSHDQHIRYEASLFYKVHPHGGSQNLSKFIDPENYPSSYSAPVMPSSEEEVSVPSRRRVRRGFWEGIEFTLASPSVDWKKRIGSSATGAQFGLTIRNELNMKISPLSGHLRVDLFDEAFATALVGLVGQQLDIARARFCFNGYIEYNLNILKEFGVERINDLVKVYDIIIDRVVGNIVRGVDKVVNLFNGDTSIGLLFEQFIETLETIPTRISSIRSESANAVARLSRFDPDQLPPSIRGVIDVINSAAQLFSDIKTDVMELYQAVNEAITVTLPWAAEQIWMSVNSISDNIGVLLKSPAQAIGDIFKGLINIKTAVDAILEAKMDVDKANFFKEGQKPYWYDLPTVIKNKLKELRHHLGNIRGDLAVWVDEIKSELDPIRRLTGGAIEGSALRRQVQEEILNIMAELIGPIQPLEDLIQPFIDLYEIVTGTIDAVKEAYLTLKDNYQKSQTLIMKLFGPKAHKNFPRKFREPGSGECASGGFYPTDSAGFYQDKGVDLEFPQGTKLVAPFSGLLFKSVGQPYQVTLLARGGAFRNIKMIIDNITPNSSLSETKGLNVIAGSVMGVVRRSSSCSPPNYIHFSVKTIKPNRLASFLDSSLNDEPSAADEAAAEGYVDPSNYLAKRPLELPQWTQICDDYKLVWRGMTVKEGSLLKRGDKNGKKNDTTPKRKTPPNTSSQRPNPSKKPPPPPQSNLNQALVGDKKKETQEALGLPEPKIGSGSPFKNFSLRNLKIKSILAFARKIGLEETADDLLTVVKTIVKLVSDKPCVLPESMTSDTLRIELQQRGLDAEGDRQTLLQRYKQPDDRCPLIQVSLPKNVYCKIDESCLGVECCMNVKLFMISLAFKAFMRFDPCEFQFVLGVNSWNYTLQILDVEFGKEWEIPVPFDIPFIDDMELHLRYGIEKSRTELLVSMSVGFCPTTGDADCLPFISILKDTAVPLPICHPNGTITWPNFDLKEYFSRAALKNVIKSTGEELLQAGTEYALNYVLEELGIPKELLEGKEACPFPSGLSNTQLIVTLEDRELAITGSRMDKELRLSQDDRSCQFFTLPVFSPEVAKVAYCSLTENCLRLDCCLQLNIEAIKFRRSFKAFVEVDACDFTFHIAFQHLQYKKLLLSYEWGKPEQQMIGSSITLKFSINKLDDLKVFEINFGAAICSGGSDCVFELDIIQDYQVPIPFCNSNFSFALPGGDDLKDFVTQVGRNAGKQAINILLEYIGLRDKINDGPCLSTIPPQDEEVCTSVTLPALPNTVTCDLADRCLGIRCCVELDLKITILSVNMWLILEPCEFTLTIGVGAWSHTVTIFDYHWGTQEHLQIGKALTIIYTIDKLTKDKVFVLDMAVSLCLPESECDTPSIDILKGTRVPIPLCNENFTLPGDGTVKGFLQMVGQNAAESAIDAILEYLGLSDYISLAPCERPQVTQNGWQRLCPKDVKLPRLPPNLICTLPEKCLGFDCCLELRIPGITPISTTASFIFDPCNFELSMSLGSWSQRLQIFSYQWGQMEEVSVGEVVSGERPVTFSVTIDKLDAKESFQISLDITICIDGDCTLTPVLVDSLVPIPFCNLNASFELPGDGSFEGLARELAGNVGELAIQAGLRKLGIQQYIDNQGCEMEILAPSENKCPLLRAPAPTNLLTCTVNDRCLGLTCCASLDLVFTQLSTTAYAILDPCEFELSVGLGTWSKVVTIFQYDWGVEKTLDIGDAVHVIYNVDKRSATKEFLIDLSVTLCIDGTCKPIHLLQAAHVPIPICNPNATFTLPGDGTINGYLTEIGGQVSDAAVDVVLDYLDLRNFVSRDACNLPPMPPEGSPTCPVQFPDTIPQLSCRIDGLCTNLHCCLTLDLKLTEISSKAWFVLDACDYKLSVGLELWYYNVSLFSYDWGTPESFMIGNALEVRFAIDKLDVFKEYEVDLAFSLTIDGDAADIPVMANKRIPIPVCNANFSAALPGDGSVKGFLQELGDNVGQAAILLVLKKLGLEEIIGLNPCVLPSAVATSDHCPSISLPDLEGTVECFIDERCLGIQCCTTLDFAITQLMLSAKIYLDPCNFELYIAFEKWELNITLFEYSWGKVESLQLGNAMAFSFSIDKLTAQKVFSVSLNLDLCIDDVCTTTPVLEGVWVPIPLCNTNASAYTLPGDGTVDGFVRDLGGRIGNSAIDLVLQKLGLSEYLQNAPCNLGIPGTLISSCPAVELRELPDFLSCSVTETCLGIRCCLEMDLKITKRSVNAWVILDPCHFNLSIGFEKWELALTLFHYPLGDVRVEMINDVLRVRWRVAKITEDKQFEIDLALIFCVDGVCDTLIVLEGSRVPIPFCNTEESLALPGDGSISGFISYLGGNVGQFAVDAAIRHLNLGQFLTGKACTYPRQDVCASAGSILGNCTVLGETCTELRCCLELDLKIADVSSTAWFKFNPCDFTFTLGLEKWTFHGSVFNYEWGTEMTESIASGMTLKYSIDKLDDTKEFGLSVTLEYCIDEVCNEIIIQHNIPIPLCNPGFSNYTVSADGFIETVAGQVIEGASVALLTRLGIDPDIFTSQPCMNPVGNQSFGNCPSMQIPSNLSTLAHCGVLNTCFGIHCCLDVNLGPLRYSFGASMVIDPCIGQLTLRFGNWRYSKSLAQLDFGTSQELTIGNFVTLRYTLGLMDGEIIFTLSLEACIDGQCTGSITLLDEAESPLPACYPNGTVSWRSIPGVTSISHLGSLDVGFEAVAQALGLPSGLVSASPCPPVLLPGQSGECPHLPRLPSLSSGGVCHYSDTCLGVECCLGVDLGLISRTLRAWLIIDPCDFTLSLGFENWSYNITLFSYKFGKVTRERLSEAVSVTFTIDKSADNRNFLLSLSVTLCISGVCAPDISLLDASSAPIPFCNPNGTLEWVQDLAGGIDDYASGLVVNRLSVSTDVLLPSPCAGPPEQITPVTSGCGHLALPSPVASYCSLDQSCLGIGCCLNFDLGIVQRSFSLWVKLDPCTQTFSFGFEKWSHVEALAIQLLQSHSFERMIGVLKIRYDIERPHATVYDVDLDIRLCWEGVCDEPTVILQDAMFSGPQCGGSSGGSERRRKRRDVDDLSSASAEGLDNMNDLGASSIDKAREYFKNLLAEGGNPILSGDDNHMTKLQPDKVVEPRLPESGTASRRSMGLLVFSQPDDTPISSRRRRSLSISASAGGSELFGLSLEPGADSGTWQGDVIIGGGLTQKGLDAFGQRVANMTIGELEAMLDLQNVDPLIVVQLMKDMRSLFRTFVEELIDVITSGGAGDDFEQFDLVLSGTIPFPRREAVFFRYEYITYLGGFITLQFNVKAGGFFDMEIPVSVAIVSMKAIGGCKPMVGGYVRAGVSLCYGPLCGSLELKADILHTSFPTIAEIGFAKFPLDVGLKLDVEMIPLRIVLKGKVSIKIPFFGRHTLFSKDLWRYEASKISGNIFFIEKKDPDKSPPEISDYSTPDGVARRSTGSNECKVQQVYGLDYTEPAFQLEMVADDDKSLVTFTYQVGTSQGGSDVLEETEFGGPSAIISQTLPGGRPLYFTAFAKNNGGGTSKATCHIPTFDVTLPTGRITPDFISTSHPNILRASAVVYDDSEIIMQKEGVGFGTHIWGDQIIPWNEIDISKRQNIAASGNHFDYFTAAKRGRLISTPTASFNQPNANFCARDCLALPETKCLSINYDYQTFTCELLEEIEGHGVEVHEYGLYAHLERLGVGHAVKFNHDSVFLVHNNMYYFNIEMVNFILYENIIPSLGILADFTPPDPGLIANGKRDETVHEACVDFTPDEWERRCIQDTPLVNHRYIVDGPGSGTVFNGHKELIDMLYTRSNTFMAANWEGFHDNETGLHGYTWSVGYDICDDDVSNHIDPHAHLFDESEWTHEGLIVNVNLPDGIYFITVRALNKVEFGGPMALTVCHTTPLIIDNTPPIIYSIYDITYDSSIGRIGMTVNATDPESLLFEYHIAMGRTPRDISLRDWERHDLEEQLFTDYEIPNGIPCWVKVRAVNNVDLRAIDHADEPILVDDTPPIAGDLFDGPYSRRDLVFTKDRNQICANWYNWYDPESGISVYDWGVGTSPGLTNIQDSIEISRREHSACSGYVTLQHGETYYSTLTAFHGGYDKLNVSASSNGVTVDLTPPVEGSVYDGLLPGPTDLEFSSRSATVEAQWLDFTDPESGIEDYEVTVYRKHAESENSTDEFEVIHEPDSVGKATSSIEWHHFHLHHKDQIFVNLRTINQAVNHIDTRTNGVLIDLTPPMLRALGDGLQVGEDADFQSNDDSLSVHWDYYDDESGIESYELAIYEMKQGNKLKIFPMDENPNSFHLITDINTKSYVQSDLMLRSGSIYITRIKARNRAKLIASHETSGIRVDSSPPVMRYVRGGNLDGEQEEVIYGYLYQNSHITIQASWLALDGQSGIKNYWVAVGSRPDLADVRPFTPMGSKSSGVISDLNLELTDPSTCDDEAYTSECQPVYYVCVKSENGAGAFSHVMCSSPIRVVEEDQTGFVTDGPNMLEDLDAQIERTTVTIWFDDFESELNGIAHYEWSVGTSPGGEDVQPLTSDGIVPGSDPDVPGLAGRGKAQSPLPLKHGVTYYSTLRAITTADNILESSSNGFKVDVTPPEIKITELGLFDASKNLNLDGDVRLYQSNTDSIDATWEIEEEESEIVTSFFSMGQYPGSDDIYPVTATNKSYVPLALIQPQDIGFPNFLGIEAVNSVGLRSTVYATSVTADNTPPSVGKVRCPAFLHADSILLCHWSDFLDAESGVENVRFVAGSGQGQRDVYQSDFLPGSLTHYSVKGLDLIHNKVYYVTVEAFNAVNQSTLAFSGPIEIDDTPPTYGLVVELSGIQRLNSTDPKTAVWDCTDAETCLLLDAECLGSINQMQVLWQHFTDEDTEITKYEVALGTTPGGSHIKAFYEVSRYQTSELITGIDLNDVRQVYATVRGYNQAGLTSTAVSNGIYVSRFSAGLQPLRPFEVKDGVTDKSSDDSDFQTSLNVIDAAWDFSGDPCPMKKYEWSIYRIDGLEIQPLVDVGERTSDTNAGIEMTDGQTYYTVVRATNALGMTISVRSDGITVKRDPLIPGTVYDGPLVGVDLTYQKETDTISASWSGFGQGMPAKTQVEHTGNEEVSKDETSEQTVDFYEAAVGTDRRYPKTRDNVVPFTYVGKNTSVTFSNLNLASLDSTYYVTVRGHSASFASAEVTSTGIEVGVDSKVAISDVEIPAFINSLSEVQLQWDEFESAIPILLYYTGLGQVSATSESPEDMNCLDMIVDPDQSKTTFNERPMRFTGKDTFVKITDLNLMQEGSYFVTVVGMNEAGQCNASTSYFLVDITPPVEGQLRAGPFYDMIVTYTDRVDSISITWKDYEDEESGLKAFNIRVLEAASCSVDDADTLIPLTNQDWLVVGPDIREFTFVDLSLAANHPYFVELRAINWAGNSIQTRVGPVFMDSSQPSAGLVVDGVDFKMDLTDTADRHQVQGTILHLPDPDRPLCPLKDIPFTDPQWSAMKYQGLWNMHRAEWDLKYEEAQVVASEESVTLKLERDTRQPRMVSGAYVTNAQIVRSSEYEFDLLAAPPALHSITSILFWDGPEGALGEFDFTGPENWQEGICQCCYVVPLNQTACPLCDCYDFLGVQGNTTFYTNSESQTTQTTTEAPQPLKVTSPATPWSIQKRDADEDGISDEDSGRWETQKACGIQFYPNGNSSQALFWCRYYLDEWPMTSELVELDFDPSVEERHYSIQIKVTPFDSDEDEWSLDMYVDGDLLASLAGIPVLSPSTKLILHVFNRDSYVPELLDLFRPPAVSATLRNPRMPPDQSELCRYGAPFRAGTSPVSRYFAGVGTEAKLTDIADYEEIAKPCVPCIRPCDRYDCDASCSMDAVPIIFTLSNLTLPRLVRNMTSSNETEDSNSTTSDTLLYPFFLTVKCYLGNGQTVVASSNGFYVDDTPAKLDIFYYKDGNLNEFEPTWFQSSKSTIEALWGFIDMESGIKEHYWAIGTSRGATDLQDFVYVGLNQTAASGNLTGLLYHNTTYYVTLKAINGAGLESIIECDGITVLLEEPTADDVNTTSMFSEKFEEEVFPPDVEKSSDPTKTGTSFSRPEDKSVTRYEFCVSSSADLLDDIVPCMPVGGNSSGTVAIEGGTITITAGDAQETYDIADFKMPKESPESSNKSGKFNMEPGKTLHSWMKMCNSARLCVTKSAGTTTILEESDTMMTSTNGTDLVMTSGISQRRRRRRAIEDNFDFTLATSGGLPEGGSLILGLLDFNRTSQEFTSDASPDYKPFITNPLESISSTSRLLRNRIRFVYEPTFYVTSLGQTELRGPLMINFTLTSIGNWTEERPRLIFWNNEDQEWQDAAKTCSDVDKITYQEDINQVNVEVCATKQSARRSRRAVVSEPRYFSRETQFALALVSEEIPNGPPEITNYPGNMVMNEDEGTLVFTFQVFDPDDDNLVFELGGRGSKGEANITQEGVFSFTPCLDCNGIFSMDLIVREIQTIAEITPLTTTVSIVIIVRPINDNPVVYIGHNGVSVGNGRVVLLTVEQNSETNVAYKDLVAEIGAYDIDFGDTLTMINEQPVFGQLTLETQSRMIPLDQDCSKPSSGDVDSPTIPCGLDPPHDRVTMSWSTVRFTYTPNPMYHGRDSFLVLIEDQTGAVSQLLEVQIAVLVNPCINRGTCGGPEGDQDCTSPERSSGFDSYFCICLPGWVGDTCEIDYDECQSAPCEFPYVCYDFLDAYVCSCAFDDPYCDSLHWRARVVLGVLLTLIGLLIIAGLLFLFYKKNFMKSYDIHEDSEDDKLPSISETFVDPAGSSNQDGDGTRQNEKKDKKKDDDSTSSSSSDDSPSSSSDHETSPLHHPVVAVTPTAPDSARPSRKSSASSSSSSDSSVSSKSKTPSKKSPSRPWSGLKKPNAVGDSSSLKCEESGEGEGKSCDEASPNGSPNDNQSPKTDSFMWKPRSHIFVPTAWGDSNQKAEEEQEDDMGAGLFDGSSESDQRATTPQKNEEEEKDEDLKEELPGVVNPFVPSQSPEEDSDDDDMGFGLFSPPSQRPQERHAMQLPNIAGDDKETDMVLDLEETDESKV